MGFERPSEEVVDDIHEQVPNPGELRGPARDKSLASALARVENRLARGLIEDTFELGAMYAVATVRRHCVNGASKRTAHQGTDVHLVLNGERIAWTFEEVGPMIVEAAQGRMETDALAVWLHRKAGG